MMDSEKNEREENLFSAHKMVGRLCQSSVENEKYSNGFELHSKRMYIFVNSEPKLKEMCVVFTIGMQSVVSQRLVLNAMKCNQITQK